MPRIHVFAIFILYAGINLIITKLLLFLAEWRFGVP